MRDKLPAASYAGLSTSRSPFLRKKSVKLPKKQAVQSKEKKRKTRVRFAPDSEILVVPVPRIADIPKKQAAKLWWSPDEYDELRTEYKSVIYLMEQGQETSEESRGLEERTEEGAWKHFTVKRRAMNAVLEEQDRSRRQRLNIQINSALEAAVANSIASEYMSKAADAVKDAIRRGKKDAKEARKYRLRRAPANKNKSTDQPEHSESAQEESSSPADEPCGALNSRSKGELLYYLFQTESQDSGLQNLSTVGLPMDNIENEIAHQAPTSPRGFRKALSIETEVELATAAPPKTKHREQTAQQVDGIPTMSPMKKRIPPQLPKTPKPTHADSSLHKKMTEEAPETPNTIEDGRIGRTRPRSKLQTPKLTAKETLNGSSMHSQQNELGPEGHSSHSRWSSESSPCQSLEACSAHSRRRDYKTPTSEPKKSLAHITKMELPILMTPNKGSETTNTIEDGRIGRTRPLSKLQTPKLTPKETLNGSSMHSQPNDLGPEGHSSHSRWSSDSSPCQSLEACSAHSRRRDYKTPTPEPKKGMDSSKAHITKMELPILMTPNKGLDASSAHNRWIAASPCQSLESTSTHSRRKRDAEKALLKTTLDGSTHSQRKVGPPMVISLDRGLDASNRWIADVASPTIGLEQIGSSHSRWNDSSQLSHLEKKNIESRDIERTRPNVSPKDKARKGEPSANGGKSLEESLHEVAAISSKMKPKTGFTGKEQRRGSCAVSLSDDELQRIKKEPSQRTKKKRTDPVSKPTPKSKTATKPAKIVHFNDSVETLPAFKVKSINKDRERRWISATELQEMEFRYGAVLELMDQGASIAVVEQTDSSRGLEDRTDDRVWALYERKRDALNCVLNQQDLQRKNKYWDPEEIRDVYKTETKLALKDAKRRGFEDAKEASKYRLRRR